MKRGSIPFLFALVGALAGTGCGTTGSTAKGPENEPIVEGQPKQPAATPKPVEEVAPIEQAKPKPELQKGAEEAFTKAVDAANRTIFVGTPTEAACRQSARTFADLADDNPKLLAARFNEGLVYQHCGQLKQAEDSYRKVLASNPRYANAIAGLGVIALKNGDQHTAEQRFRDALSVDQRCLAANVNMAALLREKALQSGDQEAVRGAQDAVRRALAVDGGNMAAYTTLALLYLDLAGNERTKLEMAQTVVDQAKRINAKYPPIWNVSGLMWLKKKNVTLALKEFRRAVELDPSLVDAHMNIGAITLSFRDYVSAEQAFRAVLSRQPKNADAALGLGVALRGQRKIKQAEEQYLLVAKLDPQSCAVPYDLGLLYQDYMSGAEAELRKAQSYFREFESRCSRQRKDKLADAERRIKNIDETFKALAEAKAMEANQRVVEDPKKAEPEKKN